MSVTYLTTPIEETRRDPPPRGSGMTREGYTKRSGAPTDLMIRLQGEKKWRRLMIWQFSNIGTLFVRLNGKPHVVREEMIPTAREAAAPSHATKKKSPAQLDREIAEAISKRGYHPREEAASFAELHRRTSREIDREQLNRALAEIYDAMYVVATGPKIYMYGSKDDAQEFIRGLPRYAEGHPLEIRAITAKEQHDLAKHKRQAYRNP